MGRDKVFDQGGGARRPGGGHFHKNWQNDDFRKIVLNATLWIREAAVPEDGVASAVTEDELKENLDPKKPKN